MRRRPRRRSTTCDERGARKTGRLLRLAAECRAVGKPVVEGLRCAKPTEHAASNPDPHGTKPRTSLLAFCFIHDS